MFDYFCNLPKVISAMVPGGLLKSILLTFSDKMSIFLTTVANAKKMSEVVELLITLVTLTSYY